MAIRLLHTADVYLGRAFGYLGEHARPQHQQRLLHTFERLILTARQHNCHALLVAGDLFEQLRETCRQLNATIAFEAVSGMTAAPINPSDTIARLNLYNRSVNDFAAQNTEGLIS